MDELAIDNIEVEKVLDEHRGILNEHGEKIQRLEIDNAVTKKQVENIEAQMIDMKTGFARLEHTVTTSYTSLMQMQGKMVEDMSKNATQIAAIASNNNAQIEQAKTNLETTKNQNKYSVIASVLKILGSVIAGILLAKYGINIGQ